MDTAFDGIDEIKISDQKVGKKLHVNLLKKVNTKFGDNYFVLDKVNKYCFYANSLLKTYINKILDRLNTEDNQYYYINDNQDDILTLKIISETKDKKTGKPVQKYDIKSFCNGGLNTAKTFRVLDLGSDHSE